ncbi:MAG: PilZ domain-containing protein [Acidobacteriota bacterium]|nr:PilZ domain-containing protein [Acidobacteriota bacterium]
MIESQRFRVWNTTRDSLLCAEIAVADAGHEDLDGLIQSVVTRPGAGLWLRPCLGAPVADGAPPFDMVCIDQNCKVVEQYESFISGSFVLFRPSTTGALIFPARTIAASQTRVGDALDILLPDEEVPEVHTSNEVGETSSIEESAVELEKKEVRGAHQVAPSMTAERGELEPSPNESLNESSDNEVPAKKKDSLAVKFLRWLVPDRRKDERRPSPKLTAHRWSGDQMYTYAVEDVSSTGIYVVTDERPFRGTIFMVTLKKKSHSSRENEDSISVQGKVVRWGENGLGLEFITSDGGSGKDPSASLDGGVSSIQLQTFLKDV